MPIILPEGLACAPTLRREGIEVLHRPPGSGPTLRVGFINLMPDMASTERQFARLLGATHRHVELVLALPPSHRPGQASTALYSRWDETSLPRRLDGLIVTGAPLEHIPFEEVTYWRELARIYEWAASYVDSTLYICWAAFAALHAFHGVRTRMLPRKISGVFRQQVMRTTDSLTAGLGESFPCPVSRYAEVAAADMPWRRGLDRLAQSPESGLCLVADAVRNAHYMFNHLEYDADTLKREYLRDRSRRTDTSVPQDYLPNNDVSQTPPMVWRRPAETVFANWLAILAARSNADRNDQSAAPHGAAALPTMTVTNGDPTKRSATAAEAARSRYDRALGMLLTHRGDAAAAVDRALAADPAGVSGHRLRAAIIVCGDDDAARGKLVESIAAIEAACPDPRGGARRHAAAAHAWLVGDQALALERYGAIVRDCPRDVTALAAAHALDFRLGRRPMLRHRVGQALAAWDATMPHYASVLAMHAFSLEENGLYARAEAAAHEALAHDQRHPGAIHVLAHVLEMQGRFREGLALLAATEPAWIEGTGFSVHLAWHRALFHLEADDTDAALAVYDVQIARVSDLPALADASALLWRLMLRSVPTGDRWRRLADHWEMRSLPAARPFYSLHAMMAFAATGRADAAARTLAALPDLTVRSPTPPEDALARSVCSALLAFARGDYAASVEQFAQVRHIADRCGGSLAQCDLVHLTFTEAALRDHRMRLARALVAERAAQRPDNRLNRQFAQRIRTIEAAVA